MAWCINKINFNLYLLRCSFFYYWCNRCIALTLLFFIEDSLVTMTVWSVRTLLIVAITAWNRLWFNRCIELLWLTVLLLTFMTWFLVWTLLLFTWFMALFMTLFLTWCLYNFFNHLLLLFRCLLTYFFRFVVWVVGALFVITLRFFITID